MSGLDQLCILLQLPVIKKSFYFLITEGDTWNSIFTPVTTPPGLFFRTGLSGVQHFNSSIMYLYFSCVSLIIFFNSSTRSAVSFRTMTSSTVSTTSPFSPRFLLQNKRKEKLRNSDTNHKKTQFLFHKWLLSLVKCSHKNKSTSSNTLKLYWTAQCSNNLFSKVLLIQPGTDQRCKSTKNFQPENNPSTWTENPFFPKKKHPFFSSLTLLSPLILQLLCWRSFTNKSVAHNYHF